MPHDAPDGALDGGYADRRESSKPLRYRYKLRARMAVDAFGHRAGRVEAPRVLDLGAAEGRTLVEIKRLLGDRGEYHGVEITEDLVAAAATRYPDDVRVLGGDVMDVPKELERGSYDLCTALAVLEHLEQPERCVAEAYAMLRPGGVFVATCPSPFWDDLAGRLGLLHEGGDHHEHELRIADLERILSGQGFEDIVGQPFMWAPVGTLPYLGVGVAPDLGFRIDGLVRKLRLFNFTFVNQAVVAVKPITG